MVLFNLWKEAFYFFLIYSAVIIIPCTYVGIIGHKMITELGQYPSKTPSIQLSILSRLAVIELITFYCLLSVFFYFS